MGRSNVDESTFHGRTMSWRRFAVCRRAEAPIRSCFKHRRSAGSSPTTSAATPVSAATEQEHQHNDNQDQFHENSPLTAIALSAAYPGIQRRLQGIVPDKRATPAGIARL